MYTLSSVSSSWPLPQQFSIWPHRLGINPQATYGNVLKHVKNRPTNLLQQVFHLNRRFQPGVIRLGCISGIVSISRLKMI